MIIEELKEQGFCYGVKRAIKIALDAHEKENNKIYLLGDIVHNKHISAMLKEKNIITIEGTNRLKMLDEVPDNATIIFSAHGVSDAVRNKAKRKNLKIVDATCPYVEKTFNLMQEQLKAGADILFIGKGDHPETEAALELGDRVHLVNDSFFTNTTILNNNIKIAYQTTMSKYDVKQTYNKVLNQYPQVSLIDMICKVTENRQRELTKTLKNNSNTSTLVIVVGDKMSNNSTKLYELALRYNYSALFIESIEELNLQYAKLFNHIIVASGTSTPYAITKEVINVLKKINTIDSEITYLKSTLTINDFCK